jgi:transposase-like protein
MRVGKVNVSMKSSRMEKTGVGRAAVGQVRRLEEPGALEQIDGEPTTPSPVVPVPSGSTTSDPDPEVSTRPTRRRYTAAYKLKILRDVAACRVPGAVGSLLRREGLYSSLLSTWRRQQEEGALHALAGEKRGPKADPDRQHPLAKKLSQSETKIRQLERKLKQAHLMLELQKKVSEILGISLAPMPNDESES